jgi:hypothetical protein
MLRKKKIIIIIELKRKTMYKGVSKNADVQQFGF